MVVMPVMMPMVVVHGRGESGTRGEQQQCGNDGYFLHDGDLYLEIWGLHARTSGTTGSVAHLV
jgi:hypothetical protein